MSLSAGHKLAHYEILEPIGKGGMGEVYRAKDGKLGRDVAIKVLPDEFAQDEERLRRFQREAKVLASLNHPNIAAIYGLEQSGATHYLILELVPGETLEERIARGPIPLDEAIEIVVKIAEALEDAHEHGIVHRDLKPANIKLTPDGKVKVLDFGLAKAFAGDDVDDKDSSNSPTLTKGTQLGAVLGTAAYMSPEQARGKPVDARTDIWAFGCCLYEALTRMKVFDGESVTDILAAVVKNEPDWDALASDTPPRVRSVLRRCLRKDKRLRLHHVADARLELLDTEPALSDTATGSRRESRWGALALAALLASGVTGLLVLSFVGRTPAVPRPVTRAVLPLGHELATGLTPSLAISPDAKHVAYILRDAGIRNDLGNQQGRLYIHSLDEAQGRPAQDTEGAVSPFFSPDGRWVGFHADGRLLKVSLNGGAPIRIADVEVDFRGADWSEDGNIYFSPRPGSGLWRVSAEGGTPESVTVPNAEKREKSHRNPSALPGGRAVLFALGSGDIKSWDDASIAVLSLDTGQYEVLVEGGMNPRYSRSGHLLYARQGTLLAVPFDIDSLEITGAPVTVVEDLMTSPYGANAEVTLSRDGHLVYAAGSSALVTNDLQLVDRQGARTNPIRENFAQEPRFSPDGRRLTVWLVGGNDTVGIYDLERGIMTELARGFDNRHPVWSPQGDRLAFSSNRAGAFNLYMQSADGSTPPERLTTSDYTQSARSWSPDGQWIAFTEERPETGRDLWVLSLENEGVAEPFAQSDSNESQPQFSPDGNWIAYESDETGQSEIHVRSFRGSGEVWQASSDGGMSPRWNPDRSELFYLSSTHLMVVDVNPGGEPFLGRPRALFEQDGWRVFDVSPDGQRFVVTKRAHRAAGPKQLNLILNWTKELERLVPIDN